MKWDVLLPGLRALLAQLTGLQVGEKDNGDQKFTSAKKKGQLSFSIMNVKTLGRDEIRREYDEDEDVLTETICGNREFTLGLLFEGFDHSNKNAAAWYLERVVTRLSRSTSKAALLAIETSWVGVSPFVNLNLSISDDDRVFSRGQREFTFLTCVNDADDSDGIGDYIQTVELYSDTLDDVSGTPLGQQISFTGPPAP